MSSFKLLASIIFLTIWALCLNGQIDHYNVGLTYFEKGLYSKAKEAFNLDKQADQNKDLLIKRIISNYHLNDLETAKSDVPQLLSFKKPPAQLELYIAKIYHAEGNFIKAATYYKTYLKGLKKDDSSRPDIIHFIKQCHSGSTLRYKASEADIQNPGLGLNSKFGDYGAIQSPSTPDKFYFNSNRSESKGGLMDFKGFPDETYGQYYSDIYSAQIIDGQWGKSSPIPGIINTSHEEQLLNISSNGQKLLYLKNSFQGHSQIYINTFHDSTSLRRLDQVFESVISPQDGDKYVFVCNDSLILYASKKNEGYGGYDLYLTSYQLNGWTKGINLGPRVNSNSDDVCPFLSKDGKQLYFSSNSDKSIGGQDIFVVDRNSILDQWSSPKNLGSGFNSPQDDLYFRLTTDGRFASFSSNRIDSQGGLDIYLAALLNNNIHMSGPSRSTFDVFNTTFLLDYPVEYLTPNLLVSNNSNNNNTQEIQISDAPQAHKLDELFYKKIQTEFEVTPEPKDSGNHIFEVRTINSNSNTEINFFGNVEYLDSIISILKKYPEIILEIDGHYFQEQLNDNSLFFSMKRAETLAAYLQQKGISWNQLILKGSGSNYPLINNNTSKFNDRIEIKFHPDQIDNLRFINAPNIFDVTIRDPSWEIYQEQIKNLSYKVQITETDQLLQNPILNIYENGMIEKDLQTNVYRYTVGLFRNYEAANVLKKKLNAGGIEGSRIIPFINGKRISNKKLVSLAKVYPDLVNYLQYSKQ